jgi:hypothetical protein
MKSGVVPPTVERRRTVAINVMKTVWHRLLMTWLSADGATPGDGTGCMAEVFR